MAHKGAFRTAISASRKRQLLAFPAASFQVAAPSFPVAALGAPVVRRRRDTTNRRALEVGDITSALVAPLIGALPRPKANVVWFERRIQLPLPLAIYPPPVGPPASVTLPAPTASRRHDGPRRQHPSLLAEFTATPPTTSPVTVAALATRKVHKRRQRHGLLLSGGAGIFDSPAVTYAVTPAALHKQGHFKRRDTERRLQTVTPLAEFTVAAYTPSDALVTGEPFRTFTSRSRRMVRQPVPASFAAGTPATFSVTALPAPEANRRHSRRRLLPPLALAEFTPTPPTTSPVVALPIPKANRRRPRRGVLLTGGDGVFQPPYIVLPAPKAFRVEHQRKLVRLTPLAEYAFAAPPTFPVVALPAPKAYRTHGLVRTLLLPPVWFDVPETVASADDENSGGWWPDYHHVRRIRDVREREQRERDEELRKIQDATDREIALLLAEQARKDADKADLERLQALADKYAARVPELPKAARIAILNAYDARTRNALEQMRRVLDQIELEEHIALIAALLLDDE